MSDRKSPIIKMTSAKGTFKWPKLNEPDYGSPQYPVPEGTYSTKMVFQKDDPAFLAMVAKLRPLHDAAVAAGREKFAELPVAQRKKLGDIQIQNFFTPVYDKETEEETGDVEMKFSMKASGVVKKGPRAGKKWSRKPTIFDAKGRPMLKAPDIWGGTVGKVSFSVDTRGYFVASSALVGISLKLEAVQIIDLVSGGQRAASDYGFEEEEGYEYAGPAEEEVLDEFTDETGGNADPEGASDF